MPGTNTAVHVRSVNHVFQLVIPLGARVIRLQYILPGNLLVDGLFEAPVHNMDMHSLSEVLFACTYDMRMHGEIYDVKLGGCKRGGRSLRWIRSPNNAIPSTFLLGRKSFGVKRQKLTPKLSVPLYWNK